MNKIRKQLNYRETLAKKGDVAAMFQLYEDYSDIKELEKAQIYLSKCNMFIEDNDEHGMQKNKLQLKTLNLINFRKFEKLDIKFNDKMTVIIGDNGAGKTSILDSIAKTLSWLNDGIVKEGDNGKRITYSDINNSSDHYANINAVFSYGKNSNFSSNLSRSIQGAKEKKDSYVIELKSLANLWRVVNAECEINLPIFAFYSVERSHSKVIGKLPFLKNINNKRMSRFDAYLNALDGAGRFDHFCEWFIALSKKTESENLNNIKDLTEQIDSLESAIPNEESSLWPILFDLQEKLREAKANQSLNNNLTKTNSKRQLEVVVGAITDVIHDIEDIFVDVTSGFDEIIVRQNDKRIKLVQLSDGQRIFVGLIADLARRMTLLNPYLENPLTGQGIVLIDEIELHLHPKLQQEIIVSLQDKFPNVQFIITTHSPHVLSTVDSKCIRRLVEDDEDNPRIESPELQTKGVMSSDILEQIMGTTSVPNIVEAKWLSDLIWYIEQNKYDEVDAKELFNKVKKHFGLKHPEIIRCENQIRLQKMKLKVQDRIKNR